MFGGLAGPVLISPAPPPTQPHPPIMIINDAVIVLANSLGFSLSLPDVCVRAHSSSLLHSVTIVGGASAVASRGQRGHRYIWRRDRLRAVANLKLIRLLDSKARERRAPPFALSLSRGGGGERDKGDKGGERAEQGQQAA